MEFLWLIIIIINYYHKHCMQYSKDNTLAIRKCIDIMYTAKLSTLIISLCE